MKKEGVRREGRAVGGGGGGRGATLVAAQHYEGRSAKGSVASLGPRGVSGSVRRDESALGSQEVGGAAAAAAMDLSSEGEKASSDAASDGSVRNERPGDEGMQNGGVRNTRVRDKRVQNEGVRNERVRDKRVQNVGVSSDKAHGAVRNDSSLGRPVGVGGRVGGRSDDDDDDDARSRELRSAISLILGWAMACIYFTGRAPPLLLLLLAGGGNRSVHGNHSNPPAQAGGGDGNGGGGSHFADGSRDGCERPGEGYDDGLGLPGVMEDGLSDGMRSDGFRVYGQGSSTETLTHIGTRSQQYNDTGAPMSAAATAAAAAGATAEAAATRTDGAAPHADSGSSPGDLHASLPDVASSHPFPVRAFALGISGSAAYVASILVRSLSPSVVVGNLPWLVDAAACTAMDVAVSAGPALRVQNGMG